MKTFEIEYTTNIEDRHTVTMMGASKTEVYLTFVVEHPKHYAITDMKEL